MWADWVGRVVPVEIEIVFVVDLLLLDERQDRGDPGVLVSVLAHLHGQLARRQPAVDIAVVMAGQSQLFEVVLALRAGKPLRALSALRGPVARSEWR
jgi:hypothetical protein